MRWMSHAKWRFAEKHNCRGDDEDETSTEQLRSKACMKPQERVRKAAFERYKNLERYITNIDGGSGEKVLRALVNTRVSLLNILSPYI